MWRRGGLLGHPKELSFPQRGWGGACMQDGYVVVKDVFIESNLTYSLSMFPCSLSFSVAVWED